MVNIEELVGKKFGKLTVKRFLYKQLRKTTPKRHRTIDYYYLCQCDCGKEKIATRAKLIRPIKPVRSCGCGLIHPKHNLSNTKIYQVWANIKDRCLNKNYKHYKDYGGRGITLCEEWKKDFMNFYKWSIDNGYKEGLSIDRINNNGNYEPNNCRWTTMKVQCNNRRRSIKLEFQGQRYTVDEASKIFNIPKGTLTARWYAGYREEKLFNTKHLHKGKKNIEGKFEYYV